MSVNGWVQILMFLTALVAVTPLLGAYMRRVFERERTWLDPVMTPVERAVLRLTGVDRNHQMRWPEYAISVLGLGAVSVATVYALMRMQGHLPFNPERLGAVPSLLAFNTAVSFATNTNWQAYGGERTVSYLTQMAGLAVQNFVSAATGMAVAVAVVRGLVRQRCGTIGNFWVDLTRATLWVLLPLSLVGALGLGWLGVPQNLRPYDRASFVDRVVEDVARSSTEAGAQPASGQVIAQGPVASQEAVKMLGTNGGGFFNANSAHPFENPTPTTNLLEMVAMLAIPAGLVWMLGAMTGSRRHGWVVWWVMAGFLIAGVALAYQAEASGNPLASGGAPGAQVSGGNMEGKETRFGLAATALFATITTDASCGAVNGMHDSLTPLGGLVPLLNIVLGEVVFGGVGVGLCGMLMFVVLAVFVAGLMVGRTPEYLGKAIESFEIRMTVVAVLTVPATILVLTGVSVASASGLASISNPGPHGLTQVLYAFASGAGNNGSAFAGLNADTPWYHATIALAMIVGRYSVIVPALAMAGRLSAKPRIPASSGTFPVTGPLFGGLLAAVILIVGALTFFPALSLGPIVEHLLMRQGRLF